MKIAFITLALLLPILSHAKYKRIFSCRGEFSKEIQELDYFSYYKRKYFRVNILQDSSKPEEKEYKATFSESLTISNTMQTYTGLSFDGEYEGFSIKMDYLKATKDKNLEIQIDVTSLGLFQGAVGYPTRVDLNFIYKPTYISKPATAFSFKNQRMFCQEGTWDKNLSL